MYLTTDLDKPTRLDIVTAWKRMERADPDGSVQGRVSSGGYGVHLRSRKVLPGRVPVAKDTRVMLLDDMGRIDGDAEDTLCHNQVLFDSKGDKQAGPWHDTLSGTIAAYRRSVERLPELEVIA